MLGDKILVAPVIEQGASSRSLYLPQGSWSDYWTGKIMDGGRQVTVPAPLQQIPILVRSGSILPFISPDIETLAQDLAGNKYRTLSSDLTWRVFPAPAPARDSFTLYDGTVAKDSETPSRIEVTVEHSPAVQHYEVILPAIRPPREVLLAGKPLTRIDETKAQSQGWRMGSDHRTVHVLFQTGDFDLKVEM